MSFLRPPGIMGSVTASRAEQAFLGGFLSFCTDMCLADRQRNPLVVGACIRNMLVLTEAVDQPKRAPADLFAVELTPACAQVGQDHQADPRGPHWRAPGLLSCA